MPDSRFYETLAPAGVSELVALTGSRLASTEAVELAIDGAAPLAHAGPTSVSFLSERKHLEALRTSRAGACFIAPALAEAVPPGCIALLTPEPQAAYAIAAQRFHRPRRPEPGAPLIHPSADLEAGVRLGPGVVLGADVRVGSGSEIGAYSVIGPGVCIGRDSLIGSNVAIGFALIGDRVRILSGAVIGEAGFGIAGGRSGAIDIPQLGRVILQDGVTVGACTCIDRGAYDDTVVGENTKIDNLCPDRTQRPSSAATACLAAHMSGISGSVTIGDGAMFGGRGGGGGPYRHRGRRRPNRGGRIGGDEQRAGRRDLVRLSGASAEAQPS